MSSAFAYALVAALGNVIGALAVTRRAARELVLIEHFVAFGAGFMLAGGRSAPQAIGAAALLGVATLAGVVFTDQIPFLVRHGLGLSAGVTIYVAASNLVPEFQGKRGWTLPGMFFAGAAAFYLTKLLLDELS